MLQIVQEHQVLAADDAAHVLYVDVETRSPASLRDLGVDRYFRDNRTEVICLGFAHNNDEPKIWTPTNPAIPWEFEQASCNTHWSLRAHNAPFEIAVFEHILKPRFGFPTIPLTRWRCTMAQALACGLPGKLQRLADALECAFRKDAGGTRLMFQMARPRRARKGENASNPLYFDDADRLQRLHDYCVEDIRVTREVDARLPQLSDTEQQVWQLSCKINDRGFHIDRALAEPARRVAQAAAPEIDAEIAELTGGAVTTINQVARLTSWLQDQGCILQKLDRKAIERQLQKNDLPPTVQRVLELRLGGAQAAVKKIDALLARAGADDRILGSFRYHGAATGRWSGEGFQAQNLKRPVVDDLDKAIAAVATGDYQHVKKLYPKPLAVVGDCIRAMVCAAPGKVLIGADFSSIESRVLAWVAEENWKLDSYRRYDATHDPRDEPYCITACRIFGKPIGTYTKDSPERNSGKTCDLAFGYAGGVNAFRKFSDAFTDEEVKAFNKDWRAAHPNIRKYWYRLDKAAWTAVQNRGRVVRCGVVTFKCNGAFLQLTLPSGRKLSYPQPRIIGNEHQQHVVFSDNAAGQFTDCRHGQGAHGGVWPENLVSGIARDLLAEAMLRIEVAGYAITMHCHDEVVAEVPEGFGHLDEFTKLMTRKPAWALDLPIAAKAWTGSRYTK